MGERNRVARLTIPAAVLVGLGVLALNLPAGALTQAQIKAMALSLSDMPTGWSVNNSSASTSNLGSGCLQKLQALGKPSKGIARAVVHYEDQNSPTLSETLESGKGSSARYKKYLGILKGCKSISITEGGTNLTGTVGAMSFPTVGDSSSAFAITLGADGITETLDIVLFRVGQVDGDLGYADYSPDAATAQAFATEAVNKIEGKAVTPVTVP